MNLRQFLFGLGVVLQVCVLGLTLYFCYEINLKREDFSEDLTEEVDDVGVRGVKIPFRHYVKGSGLIKPSTDYVKINAPFAGIIERVFVQVGQKVNIHEPLFELDTSMLKCELKEKQAEYNIALAEYNLLNKNPSAIELKMKEKEVEQMKMRREEQVEKCHVFESLLAKNAVSQCEKEEQESLLRIFAADMERVLLEYDHLKEGACQEAKEVGKAIIEEKEVSIELVQKMLSDCQILSPISGRVLSVPIHSGEYVEPAMEKSIILGSEDPLYLQVRIDDQDAWRVTPQKNLRALAIHRANPKIQFILDFVSAKPCLNENKLELVFSFEKGKAPIYLEQQLDVYIEAAPLGDTSYLDYQFSRRGI